MRGSPSSTRLCLVIPTRDRPHFLARLLRYLEEQKFPHRVLVADASRGPLRSAVEDVVAKAGNLSVRLFQADYDAHWALRVIEGLGSVDCPYAVLCGDDDFIIPAAAEEAMAFLDGHADYSIAHGRTVAVATVGGRVYSNSYRQRGVEQHDACDRLVDHLAEYAPTFYSVHRRQQLIHNFQITHENAPDYRLGEILPSTLSMVQGRSRYLDSLFIVRQDWPLSMGKTASSWAETIVSPEFSKRLNDLRSALVSELEAVHIEKARALAAINRGLETYLALALSKHHHSARKGASSDSRAWRRASTAVKIIPVLARALGEGHGLRMLHAPYVAVTALRHEALSRQHDDMALFRLRSSGSPYFESFAPIFDLMCEFPYGIDPPAGSGPSAT